MQAGASWSSFRLPPTPMYSYGVGPFGIWSGGCFTGFCATLPPVTGTELVSVDRPPEGGVCWQWATPHFFACECCPALTYVSRSPKGGRCDHPIPIQTFDGPHLL